MLIEEEEEEDEEEEKDIMGYHEEYLKNRGEKIN